uniref:reverse transcriptase domain-containing protein n=1 Tax=Frankia sp. Cr1 TaxID=3073931 RepID=UPI002AD40450
PVIVDRVQQARAKNALEPEWEARFEARSYGFRPGRGCHDAMAALFTTLKGKNAMRLWALDADLTAAFDHIDHSHLMAVVGGFPGREAARQWLKAGVVEERVLIPTDDGISQGSVISPLFLNIALHGMEYAAGVRYHITGTVAGRVHKDSPVLVRYADDLIALCHTRDQAEQVKARLATWLAPRGLTLNEDKTRIVHVNDGFDFLGFNVRRYHGKLLIKPSTAAIRRIRARLRAEVLALRGSNALAIIRKLNPIVRGWAAYYRVAVSSRVFAGLDRYLWQLTYKWGCFTHPTKSKHWVTTRYYERFNPARQDKWVFGDRESGAYLRKFAWTNIVRHQMVKGTASPDDPTLSDYWARRRRSKRSTRLDESLQLLLKAQKGRCPGCGELVLHAERQPDSPQEWELWMRTTRKVMVKKTTTCEGDGRSGHVQRLVHAWCRRSLDVDKTPGPTLLSARESWRLA